MPLTINYKTAKATKILVRKLTQVYHPQHTLIACFRFKHTNSLAASGFGEKTPATF